MSITYPTTLDTLTNPVSTDTLASPSHADQHSDINDAVEALETKVGVDSSAVTSSLDYKVNTARTGADTNIVTGTKGTNGDLAQWNGDGDLVDGPTPPSGTIVGTADTQTLTNKTLSTGSVIDTNVTVIEVLKKVYPVGCIYISVTATDPATVFGFGTWAAFGSGRTLVGKDTGTFSTVEATGGAETVTLTSAQSGVPAHKHPITTVTSFGGSTGTLRTAGGTWDSGAVTTITADNGAQNNTAANAASSHTNLQPYIVVYFFKRTA